MGESTKRKVCIVGAGAAGLCAARHFARNTNYEVQVYEQTQDIGGTWVYTEKIGLDENGLPIHSSMYRDLRTNLPAKIMNFPDYPALTAEEPCCVTHQEVRSYLENYASHFQLLHHVRLGVRVESVRCETLLEGTDKWIVRVRDLKTKQEKQESFHALMVCNGHYFDPYVPKIQGIETFPGIVTHSHVYRKPEDFSGKGVLILGAAASGVDIAHDLVNHAHRVYLSHNNERFNTALQPNVIEVAGVERIEGGKIFLQDQKSVAADVFMFCTGYKYSFPFLDQSCGIQVDDNYVQPLYKHLINIDHPTMCIVGVPSTVIPFPMFDVQVQYFLAVLDGSASLPTRTVMLEGSTPTPVKKRHAHKLANHQWEYNDSLADAGGFARLPKFYKLGYRLWSSHRTTNLSSYKRAKFLVSKDGETVELIMPSKETRSS